MKNRVYLGKCCICFKTLPPPNNSKLESQFSQPLKGLNRKSMFALLSGSQFNKKRYSTCGFHIIVAQRGPVLMDGSIGLLTKALLHRPPHPLQCRNNYVEFASTLFLIRGSF